MGSLAALACGGFSAALVGAIFTIMAGGRQATTTFGYTNQYPVCLTTTSTSASAEQHVCQLGLFVGRRATTLNIVGTYIATAHITVHFLHGDTFHTEVFVPHLG